MILSSTRFGSPPHEASATLFIAHGILGSKRNWRTFARRLATLHPDLAVVTVDLRGHGESLGLPPPHSLSACTLDVAALLTKLGCKKTIAIGHSFGAKVILRLGELHPSLLSRALLLDAPLGPRRWLSHGDPRSDRSPIVGVIEVLGTIPMPSTSREAALSVLRAQNHSERMLRWMSTNLRRTPSGFVWRFELDTVRALLSDWAQSDLWPILESPTRGFDIWMLRGELSEHLDADDRLHLRRLAERGAIELATLPRAGHWLHADNPDGLLAWVEGAL